MNQQEQKGHRSGMPDRRRMARMTIPWHLSGPGLELRLVRLLDLSPDGARIEHIEPLRQGIECFVDLPPALGRVRLTGRVAWTGIRGGEQTVEGERRQHFQSGIAFTRLATHEQTVLAEALEKLKGEAETPKSEPPH
jgi:hypothetical protein